MILITTPIEKHHTNDPNKRILLGEWCNIFDHKIYNENKSDQTIKYHWLSKKQYSEDWNKIIFFYEKYLKKLSNELNQILKQKLSIKSWEIIIGYWLIQFIGIVFDRYHSLLKAYEFDKNLTTIDYENINSSLSMNFSANSGSLFSNDMWNYKIYREIINISKIINFNSIKDKLPYLLIKNLDDNKLFKRSSKSYFKNFIGNLIYPFAKNNNIFLYNAMPIKWQLLLYLKLKNVPTINSIPSSFEFKSNYEIRKNLLNNFHHLNDFEDVLNNLISKSIPISYLEGFEYIYNFVDKLKLPKNPNIIYTNNSHFKDDVFKIWAAKKIKNKSRIYISQHGGGAFYKFSGASYFEHKIADTYLCSGPGNKINNTSKVFGNNINYKLKYKNYNRRGGGLLVLVALSRYSTDVRSIPVGEQMLDYFNDNYNFYSTLKDEIKNKFYVRIYPKGDFEWKQEQRWKSKFPNVKLDLCKLSMEKMISKNRLFVSSYNATTYNQTFVANIPTLIYWRSNMWPNISSADNIFKELLNNKIFHESPYDAANFINNIWNNIDDWWYSKKIQKVVNNYCELFAFSNNKEIDILKKIFHEEIKLKKKNNK